MGPGMARCPLIMSPVSPADSHILLRHLTAPLPLSCRQIPKTHTWLYSIKNKQFEIRTRKKLKIYLSPILSSFRGKKRKKKKEIKEPNKNGVWRHEPVLPRFLTEFPNQRFLTARSSRVLTPLFGPASSPSVLGPQAGQGALSPCCPPLPLPSRPPLPSPQSPHGLGCPSWRAVYMPPREALIRDFHVRWRWLVGFVTGTGAGGQQHKPGLGGGPAGQRGYGDRFCSSCSEGMKWVSQDFQSTRSHLFHSASPLGVPDQGTGPGPLLGGAPRGVRGEETRRC